MAATIAGRRRPDGTVWDDLEPGDYALATVGNRVRWVLRNPAGGFGTVDPRTHVVSQYDDGTITVRPSLDFRLRSGGWHGWLEKGVWRQV